ncbi:glycosyltransferase family 2 protein [Burkholderia plantarii]|uniref:Glycosyl transferase, family 2 n=2 Tax=Burkholderia plantarii TaxID=41899 RepID=A0A0B6RMZ0_BURPL|nr:glycosyltransferase [Burkholderia plantarii]AJK46702.1 glycosyl transferase, family 2 [Burkholderia plantarii]
MGHAPISQRISVVVLTWNRADELAATLGHLLALPESPPIFVADNGSDDNTVALVKARFPTVCVVECGENRGAAGRNLAAACVATDYVAFCDDDTWWEPGALARAVQVLDAWPNVGVLSARVVVGDEAATDPGCAAMSLSPLGSEGLPGPALVGYMAGACVFRTALFRDVGGYEPRLFIGGEEELVALDVLALGHSIVYCDQLTVHHHPSVQRDSGLRRRMLARNAAWVGWLRLPWPEAGRATLRALGTFAREGHLLRDGLALLRGLAWILPRRRVVPPNLTALRRRVALAGRRPQAPAPATAVAMAKAAVEAEAAARHPAGKVDVSS